MYNNVTMMGRITNDLELKVTSSGINVCSFRIAVDRRFQPKGEERKADFFNVVAWRKSAEFVCKYFGKGRMILVQGELQTRQYTDKNGNLAMWYEIIADRLSFTGEAKKTEASAPEGLPEPPEPPYDFGETAPADLPNEPSTDDDYPF